MSLPEYVSSRQLSRWDARLTTLTDLAARYSLVLVIAWIGALKFTSYEAHGIEPLVAHSPLMSWVYDVLPVTTFSTFLGVVELSLAALLAIKPWYPGLSVLGSIGAVGMFITTLSFMLSTPGVAADEAGGFPVLSSTGQFLIKDVALLALSVWTLRDSLSACKAATAS
ncbi:hypothetical protein A9W98_34610 [Mycobacterium gordonae]|jgi:uncharacterized membrane protein YkgB|uniref:DUF417 family protein n=1 Tax=Mycobacterium gordonae TaxID=1778 RepID=A0A1A6B898_MYCGO|nr:DUF417 family protein [Mycobacterium gordonae]MBI2701713.1 DUF417 family protein [Mycobacterium sp.]OBR98547.1 hypothetical protein A9W98_34610 [Mycobacterium gordonae]